MINCIGLEEGYFKLVRAGAIKCHLCELSMNIGFSKDRAISNFRENRPMQAY